MLKAAFFMSAAAFLSVAFFFAASLISAFVALFSHTHSFHADKKLLLTLLRVLKSNAAQAFLSSALALLLGIPSALFLAARKVPFSGLFSKLYFIPLCVPSLIFSLSYILFFGNSGILNTLLTKVLKIRESPIQFLYSFKAVIIAHAAYNFPLALKLILESYREIDSFQIDAAKVLFTGKMRLFTKIILPNLKNAALTSFTVIFYFSFFSFTIVLLFGGLGTTTLEVEIYRAVKSAMDFKKASAFALTGLFFSLSLGFLSERLKKKKLTLENAAQLKEIPPLKSVYERFGFCLIFAVIAIFLLLPLASVFFSSFIDARGNLSFTSWRNLFSSLIFYKALLFSLITAALTVGFTLLTAVFHTYIVYRLPRAAKIAYLPLAVSPLVLSVGFLFFPFSRSTSSFFILSVAESSLFWPYAYFLIQTKSVSLPKEAMEAALTLGSNKREAFFQIMLSFLAPSVRRAALLIFALSLADSSLPLMLNLRGYASLSLLLFSYASSYRINESAALAFFMLLLCFLRKN